MLGLLMAMYIVRMKQNTFLTILISEIYIHCTIALFRCIQ